MDFVLFADGLLVAGEAKTGPVLEAKDFRGAERAVKAGVDRFYFCTASDEFSREASDGIKGLRKRLHAQGRNVEVNALTRQDLFTSGS